VTFFGSRAANGALGLVQAAAVSRALSTAAAATFFLWWTAVWLVATVFKFGLDGILPRVVAESGQSGAVPSLRRALALGGLLGLVAAAPVFALLRVPLGAAALALGIAVAVAWAAVLVWGGYFRAIGRADLAGVTTGVLWPLAPAAAALLALRAHPGWIGLGGYSLVAAVAATGAASVLLRRYGRVDPLRHFLRGGRDVLRVEADVVGGALLSALYELMIWLPVVLAAVLDAGTAMVGAIFVSTRLGGILSWSYQGVVASLSSRLASSLARRELAEARRLIRAGAAIGALTVIPPALVLVLAARPVLRAIDPEYAGFAAVLAAIAAARAVDALTGPVGEALLVARHTWLDAGLMAAGIGAGAVLALGWPYGNAADAAAIGASAGFALANVLRVLAVSRLLRRGWS
jgi:O-antigen/teichoic acid export membrane protein